MATPEQRHPMQRRLHIAKTARELFEVMQANDTGDRSVLMTALAWTIAAAAKSFGMDIAVVLDIVSKMHASAETLVEQATESEPQ